MVKVSSKSTGMRGKLLIVAFLILVLVTATLPGCSNEPKEQIHLKIAILPYVGYTPFYISQQEGFFAEQGIEAEFVKFPSATQALLPLAQGELDVVLGSINAGLINAVAQNVNLRIVAGSSYVGRDSKHPAIVVRKDLYDSGELDTIAELDGRGVATSCTACINDFALAQVLDSAGLTLDEVTILKLNSQETITAFDNRAIDAAYLSTPAITQVQSMGYAVTLEPISNVIPDFQYVFMMFGPTLNESNPDAGKRFMVAYLKGIKQWSEGKTERNLQLAEEFTGTDRETLLKDPWTPTYADGRINIESILAFQDWAYEEDYIDQKVAEEQLIDTRFIDYAQKVLGITPANTKG
ncbi:MAG: hypothetical protein FJ004_00775 [Chloroflexi bacterium]|nr:hypothetical protein [Chloroflexota bacterium]